MKGYPVWFKARIVHFVILVLAGTGLLLGPTTLVTRLAWEVPWQLDSSMKVWILPVHTFFGLICFVLIGALWSIHMRYWWRKQKGRWSGGTVLASLLILGLSGIAILYLGHPTLISTASLVHLILGIGFIVPYVAHTFLKSKVK